MADLKPKTTTEANEDLDSSNPDHPQLISADEDKQDGVRVAQAIITSWSKKSLVISYAW